MTGSTDMPEKDSRKGEEPLEGHGKEKEKHRHKPRVLRDTATQAEVLMASHFLLLPFIELAHVLLYM